MGKFFFSAVAVAFCFVSGLWAADKESSCLWLIEEDFIKFGKKQAYESNMELWLEGFASSSKTSGFWRQKKSSYPLIGLQGLDEPQYIYLIPLQEKEALSEFFDKKEQYNQILLNSKNPLSQVLASNMNFSVDSLHKYLEDLSSVRASDSNIWKDCPHLHYWVFGVVPGFESEFETSIRESFNSKKGPLNVTRRVWKVLLGSDTPKYVILVGAPSEDLLEQYVSPLKLAEGPLKDVIRNQRQGRAIFRPQLSILNP